MSGPKIIDPTSEEQPVEPTQGPVTSSDTPCDEMPQCYLWTRRITPESVTTAKSWGRAATREHLTSHPHAVQIDAGVG